MCRSTSSVVCVLLFFVLLLYTQTSRLPTANERVFFYLDYQADLLQFRLNCRGVRVKAFKVGRVEVRFNI